MIHCVVCYYTVSKNCATIHFFITLANVGRFVNFFHCCILQEICNKTHANTSRILPWHASGSTAILPAMLLLLLTECETDRYQSCFHFTTSLAPNSTDLNPLDYKTWGEMQQQVYQVHDVDELKQRLINAWHGFGNSCESRKFWAFNELHIIHI